MRLTNGTDRALSVLVLASVLFSSVPAAAQTSPANAALAETLFRDGKERMAEKRFDVACPKLAESNRLDPGTGTLLALALCHEGGGLLASAWVEFTDVLSASGEARPDRALVAREHLAQIEPSLSKLTVVVPAPLAALPGVEIVRDGVRLDRTAWGVSVPVDGGAHTIQARAPNRRPWSAHVELAASRDRRSVEIPVLETVSPRATADSAEPSPARAAGFDGTKLGWGIGVGALGILALGAGAYFGVTAISDIHDAKAQCPTAPSCTSKAPVDLNADGLRDATIADVAIGVGIAATAVGVILVVMGRPRAGERVQVVPSIERNGASFALTGSF